MFLQLVALLAAVQCAATDDAVLSSRLQKESGFEGAVSILAEDEMNGLRYVTAEIPYRDIHGEPKKGQGRLIVDENVLKREGKAPAFCHVHYEKPVEGARTWCERGWAVSTAHYGQGEDEYPLELCTGDSLNLAKALIQWVRRQPLVDRSRLHLDGASAGGYMALALGAEMAPVTSITADAPVVNWSYNLNYFEANKPAMKYPQHDIAQSPLPVVCVVTVLTDWSVREFKQPLDSRTWRYVSPVAYAERIGAPVMVTHATADMLVPIVQVDRRLDVPYDPAAFPDQYVRDFDKLTPVEAARQTLADRIPGDEWSVLRMPLQEDAYEVTVDYLLKKEEPPEGPKNRDRPWSKEAQWSVVLLEEGPPVPHASHMLYSWATSPDTFVDHYREAEPAPGIVKAANLKRLLERYAGIDDPRVAAGADNHTVNRGNFQPLERLDVVQALLDYAAVGLPHAERLQTLYRDASLHPFGDDLDLTALVGLRNRLRAQLNLEETP